MSHVVSRVFARRLRGFRLVDLVALGCLLVLATGVYLSKAQAGREAGRVAEVDGQIADEQRRLRLLRAEVAHLETPARLERLSGYVGLAPAQGRQEAPVEALGDLVRQPRPAPAAPPAAAAPVR